MVDELANKLEEEILKLGYVPRINDVNGANEVFDREDIRLAVSSLTKDSHIDDFIVLPRREATQNPLAYRGYYYVYVKYR
jgi:hypothetical protein